MGNSTSVSGIDLIGSETPMEDIVVALSERGCKNLTSSIDLTKCSVLPLTGGGFCDLYRGDLRCGTRIAIKCLRIFEGFGEDEETNKTLKRAARELYHWSKLTHPNVLPLMGLAVFRGRMSMISEWMDNGNLMVYVRRNPDADKLRLCMNVCAGLSYIHASGMVSEPVFPDDRTNIVKRHDTKVHGDLKAANVVVSRKGVAMITDFGNSQLKGLALTLKFTNTNTNNFSLRWAAPELLLAEAKPQLTEKTDVYAYGMTALETLTGKIPFEGLNEHQVMRNVAFQQRTPNRAAYDLSDKLWELLNNCWTWDESTRPRITIVERRLNALFPRTPLEIKGNGSDTGDLALDSRVFAPANPSTPHLSTAPTIISPPALPPPPNPTLPSRVIDIVFDLYLGIIINTIIPTFRMGAHVCIIYLRSLAFFIARPFILFLLYAQNQRPCTALTSTSNTHLHSLPSRPGPKLPPEVINIIFDFYFEFVNLESKTTIRDFRTRRREYVNAVLGLKLSCRAFATQIEERMSRIWSHREGPGSCCDPAHVPKGVAHGPETRIVTADICSSCLPEGTDLSVYPNLKSASLGCHNALTYNQHTNTFRLLPVKGVVTLPYSLTQLEVLDSHRPIIQIIPLAASSCPGLTELRIVPCTMFNKPECWWWRRHWQDAEHDYMRDHDYQNVEAYAHEMADSLRALKQLKALHLGVYMTNIQSVMRHRTEHKKYHPQGFKDTFSHVDGFRYHNQLQLRAIEGPGFDPLSVALARRELWADPCPMCERELKCWIEDTEQRVAAVFGSKLKSLCTVSFPSFLSERRIRPSHWEVQREIKSTTGKKWGVVDKVLPGANYPHGAKLRVRTKRPGSRNFSMSTEFDIFMGHWTIEQ